MLLAGDSPLSTFLMVISFSPSSVLSLSLSVPAAQCSERTKKKSIIARFPFSPPWWAHNIRKYTDFYWLLSTIAAVSPHSTFSCSFSWVATDQIPTCVWQLQRAERPSNAPYIDVSLRHCHGEMHPYCCLFFVFFLALELSSGCFLCPLWCLCLFVRLLVSVLTAAKTTPFHHHLQRICVHMCMRE